MPRIGYNAILLLAIGRFDNDVLEPGPRNGMCLASSPALLRTWRTRRRRR